MILWKIFLVVRQRNIKYILKILFNYIPDHHLTIVNSYVQQNTFKYHQTYHPYYGSKENAHNRYFNRRPENCYRFPFSLEMKNNLELQINGFLLWLLS